MKEDLIYNLSTYFVVYDMQIGISYIIDSLTIYLSI